MTAKTLDEAIDIVNEVDYGLTSGLHSLDSAEIGTWLSRIEAGNLYVNRGITGAIVRRQPFGGWKKSAVGAGTKAGGLNYLLGLGSWTPAPAASDSSPSAPVAAFVRAAGVASPSLDRAVASDQLAWDSLFGTATDVSALTAERNIARYLPFPAVHVRLASAAEDAVADLVRVIAASVRAGTTIDVSTGSTLPSAVVSAVRALPNVRSLTQSHSDAAFASAVASGPSTRVRLIGGDVSALYTAIGGRPDVAVYGEPVTEAGRIEILPFVREQAVSITAHRFGTPNHLTDALI
jgi:RHH-type transcriptional regulator, proline utilization regulon repressor / proline dehydrogenase / delta 1-pyrroline-5-carboxylate dehydrogenase